MQRVLLTALIMAIATAPALADPIGVQLATVAAPFPNTGNRIESNRIYFNNPNGPSWLYGNTLCPGAKSPFAPLKLQRKHVVTQPLMHSRYDLRAFMLNIRRHTTIGTWKEIIIGTGPPF